MTLRKAKQQVGIGEAVSPYFLRGFFVGVSIDELCA